MGITLCHFDRASCPTQSIAQLAKKIAAGICSPALPFPTFEAAAADSG
jgi:hypothetical protein